jgi:hypothetical protein
VPAERFIIRGHHPLRNGLLLAAGILAAGLLAVGAYWQGGRASASEFERLRLAERDLRDALSRVDAERADLLRRAAELQH